MMEETKPRHPNFSNEVEISTKEIPVRANFTWKPKIDHLEDAIQNGKFVVPAGGRVIIQYPENYRDSCVWTVDEVEPEHMNLGYVRLYNAPDMHYGSTNFIDGPQRGLLFKIPDNSRRWLPSEDAAPRVRKRKGKRWTSSKLHEDIDLIESDSSNESEELPDDSSI